MFSLKCSNCWTIFWLAYKIYLYIEFGLVFLPCIYLTSYSSHKAAQKTYDHVQTAHYVLSVMFLLLLFFPIMIQSIDSANRKVSLLQEQVALII